MLLDRGSTAFAHQSEVDAVKNELKINHKYFDCWIYGFLENKNFDVQETVAKLKRREDMEKEDLGTFEITDWMIENMKEGIIQVLGVDKEGRVVFYVRTARDKPTKNRRVETRRIFDMFVSYGTRLRPESKRCQLVMLINQDKASLFSNVDMSFQAEIALRIAKFYPGCVDKMYICKMNRALSTVTKPIFSRLPAIVSDRIKIISAADIQAGKLLELFDEDVLPLELGGKNDCDKQERFNSFSDTIVHHFQELQEAIREGYSVKEWELMKLQQQEHITENPYKLSFLQRSVNDTGGGGLLGHSFSSMEDTKHLNTSLTDPQLHTCMSFDRMSGTIPRYVPVTAFDFMESTENFFRASIVEGYEREWIDIVKLEFQNRLEIKKHSGALHHETLFRPLPPPVQLFFRGFFWVCMTVMSLFFLCASLQIALMGATNGLYLFFSTLYEPLYIFPYGILLGIVSSQFTMFVSRGFELMANMYKGELVLPLKGLGTKAHVLQFSICALCVVACFVMFCVCLRWYGGFTAFGISASFGCLCAFCLTFVYHFFYALGFKRNSRKTYAEGGRANGAEATIYLFLDVVIDDDRPRRPTIEVITIIALLIVNFAFGVSFIFSDNVVFLCCSVVALVTFFFGIVVSTSIIPPTASSAVTLNSAFFSCVVWLYLVFILSQSGSSSQWTGSIAASIVVAVLFLILAFSTSIGWFKGVTGLWCFRMAWMTLLALHTGSIISLFAIDYQAGIAAAVLGIHLAVTVIRSEGATTYYGVLCYAVVCTILLLTCCLNGKSNADESYPYSISDSLLPNFSLDFEKSLNQTSDSFSPLCHSHFSDGKHSAATNIVGAALFAKLGFNSNLQSQVHDLSVWFPNFTQVDTIVTPKAKLNGGIFYSSDKNTTFVTIGAQQTVSQAIQLTTMWIETYSLAPLSVIVPSSILVHVAKYITFLKTVSPLVWKEDIEKVRKFINDYCVSNSHENGPIFLVGYSSTGAAAAYLLKQNVCDEKVVSFSSPSVSSVLNAGPSDVPLSYRLMSVSSNEFLFSPWDLDAIAQVFPCFSGNCNTLTSVVQNLDKYCSS